MDLTVSLDKLREHKLFIGTPTYGGQCATRFMISVLNLQKRLIDAGVSHEFHTIINESLVPRARNKLTAKFLQSDCTDLLWLDSDIGFTADDILWMIALDKDFIGAPYAKKSINWERVLEAAKKNPALTPKEASAIGSAPVLSFVAAEKVRIDEPVRVRELGTGMMLIKREVIEKIVEAHPESKYQTMVDEDPIPTYDLFHCGQYQRNGSPTNYLSEDYWLCRLWRDLGGEIYVCPWMQTTHVGTTDFQCDLTVSAKVFGTI